MAKKFFLAFIIKLSCRHCSRKILKVMYSSWVETFLLAYFSVFKVLFFSSLIQCCLNCMPWQMPRCATFFFLKNVNLKSKKSQMKKNGVTRKCHLNKVCCGLKEFRQHCFNKCFICISIFRVFSLHLIQCVNLKTLFFFQFLYDNNQHY